MALLGRRVSEPAAFLGRRVARLLALSLVLGGLLFAAEVALAYALSAFAASLGLSPGGAELAASGAPRAAPLAASGSPGPAWPLDPSRPLSFGLLLAGLAALRGSLSGAGAYAQGAATEHFKRLQRGRVVRWVFRGGRAPSDRVAVIFNEQVGQASHAVAQVQAAVLDATVALCLLPGLLWLSPGLTLGALPVLALPLVPLRVLRARLGRLSRRLLDEWTRVTSRLTAGLRNLLLLRIHGTAAREERLAEESLAQCLDHTLGYHRLAGAELAYAQTLSVALVCAVAAVARARAALPATALVAYFYLLYRFVQQLARLGYALSSLSFAWPPLRGLFAWWREAPTEAPGAAPAVEPAPAGPIGFRMRGVSFAYGPASPPVIRDRTLEVPPGAALVITGPSGSGKTTLLHLLAGELSPTSGAIEAIAGDRALPLAEHRGALYPRLGYVGAETFLVEGTIRDNLLYGIDRDPSADEVRDALATADCGFIDALADGLAHRLTDRGAGLSAGEKQRLALARALLRRPGALLLDEPTSDLDAASEERLIAALGRLKGRVTLLAATHRPALLRLGDAQIELAAPVNA